MRESMNGNESKWNCMASSWVAQLLLTSWNNAAICSIVLFSYCRHSVTGIEYGVLLHNRMQWFCTWNRCSSRISFISSKQTRAVANPSAKFAFDSLFPPLKLQNHKFEHRNRNDLETHEKWAQADSVVHLHLLQFVDGVEDFLRAGKWPVCAACYTGQTLYGLVCDDTIDKFAIFNGK